MNNFARLTIATSVIIAIFLAITFFFVSSNRAIAPEALVPAATVSPLLKTKSATSTFALSSSAFENDASIPLRYSCDAKNPISPPLTIKNAPVGVKSFVLIMDDPDIPPGVKAKFGIDKFEHWLVYNIPSSTKEVPEGTTVGQVGVNSTGKTGYAAPCPPKDIDPLEHRYHIKLFALRSDIDFKKAPTWSALEAVMKPNIIEFTELVGRYKRQ